MQPTPPFFLDFQLNYGSTPEPSNTVTLSNFQFRGRERAGIGHDERRRLWQPGQQRFANRQLGEPV